MSHKGTVLIFAYECYPYNRSGSTIGAQRPYHFAKNLSKLGWKVIVLCCGKEQRRVLGRKQLNESTASIYHLHQLSLKSDDFTIIPLPSLRSSGFWDAIWIRTVKIGPGDTYIGRNFPYSIARRISTFCNQLFNGDYSCSWTPVAKAFSEHLLKEKKIDIIIGEHSPDAGIIAADQISRTHNIPWIADFRDPVLLPFKGLFKGLYARVVKSIVRSAVGTINVNSYWTSLDQLHFGKDAHTIINGYEHDLFNEIPAYPFSKFTVSYFGSIKEESQDISASLKAFALLLKKLNHPEDVVLFYRGFDSEKVMQQCQRIGIPQNSLDIGGFVEREETIAYMKGSAVLLIYSFAPYKSRNIYEKKGFFPGKTFEYIGTGVPMLLIPSDDGLLSSLINERNKGLASSSVEAAADFLLQRYEQWKNKCYTNVSHATDVDLFSRYAQAVQLDAILSTYALGKTPNKTATP